MSKILEWCAEHYELLLFIGTCLLSFSTKFRKMVKDVLRSVNLSNRFHSAYGDTPAETIKALHEAIQTAHDVLEIRQQISEKYLKIGVYICDLDGKCLWSNEYLNEMFGLDSQAMKGFGWLQAIHSKDRKRVHEEWLYSIKEGIQYNCEYTICNLRDGRLIDARTEAVVVIDDNNEKKCYVGYLSIKSVETMNCKQCGVKDCNAHH